MTAQELRKQIGNAMGLGSWLSPWTGTAADYAALSDAQKIELTNRMRAYIREHPAEFAATVVQVASAGSGVIESPSYYGVGDAFADFASGVGEQVVDLNDNLNPFSEKNRGWVLGVVAVGVILYFAGPAIVAALRAPAKAAK